VHALGREIGDVGSHTRVSSNKGLIGSQSLRRRTDDLKWLLSTAMRRFSHSFVIWFRACPPPPCLPYRSWLLSIAPSPAHPFLESCPPCVRWRIDPPTCYEIAYHVHRRTDSVELRHDKYPSGSLWCSDEWYLWVQRDGRATREHRKGSLETPKRWGGTAATSSLSPVLGDRKAVTGNHV
jgi:hypothetical protein